MKLILGWLRNNCVTLVEAVDFIYKGVELIVNGIARLFPGNKLIVWIHDILAYIGDPLESLKQYLLEKNV